MSGLDVRRQIESRLRAEVEKAEQEFLEATIQQKPEARRRFKDALDRFSRLVLNGDLPEEADENDTV